MPRGWLPTPTERAAIDAAVYALGIGLWTDDCRQAALLALWRSSEGRDRGHYGWAYRIAYCAATDELRALTAAKRQPQSWRPAPDYHHDTPEAHARVRDAIRALQDMPGRLQRAVARIIAAETLYGIGTAHDVREARAHMEALLL